jgi:hypothetical protein
MQYFDTLPKIIYVDEFGNSSIFTNLLARVSIMPDILTNPMVFYEYDIQEGDTPEIIAFKYYDDSYRYWIVLFANRLLDPQWDWPMSYSVFDNYIQTKYKEFDPKASVHNWQKTITQVDSGTNTTTVNVVEIDEYTYNTFIPETKSFSLPTGTVTISTTAQAISYYDYELSKNEAKRSIKILNATYANQLETEFKKLMA